MKKFLVLLAASMFTFGVFGCAKKQAEEAQEPMTMEAMSTVNVASPAGTETKAPGAQVTQPVVPATEAAKLEPLPPAGPFKPSLIDIQTALMNAGFYTGNVDGKTGPKTKKAIEAFQKANNLKADGRVGPKTWELLKTHLTPVANKN
ncbi:MAG: peptidoglycan-binding domain-containing protein [Candidatus Omnitrophota bacterium]|jgi:peptidoglycan hydrolase-like protein with peptidoglycan-binding domain